jgi:cytochrome c553
MRRRFCFALLLAGVTLAGMAACVAVPRYTDLRRIEPIHGDAHAGEAKAAVCAACHGADGTSVAPNFPRLAGQREDYLYHRLVSFRYANPKDPYYSVSPMTAMAAALSEADMRDLAAYFATQMPRAPNAPDPTDTPDPADSPASRDRGEALYHQGDPALGVPPCQGCHGPEARGPAPTAGQYAAYPVLRGQYAVYLAARLSHFRGGEPADTSNAFLMHGVAVTLDDPAIASVSAWLASLDP